MARYALIIGIAEYTGSFKSLETPVQNANAIADILDQYGEFNQVKRLPFRRAAGQQDLGKVIRKPLPNETLVRELQQFLQDADGSDVLLYYSGHGFTKLDQLSQSPEGYLAPSDCQVELNAAGQIIAEKNGISLFGLNALIERHAFNSLVVILDCCHSGAFLESGMVRRGVTAFGYQRDYYLITACRSSSKAYEGEEHSLLTEAVLKGLAPENASPRSGRISGDRLFDVIGNELYNSRQEPVRMGWGRIITLVQYRQPPESIEPVAHPFNPANPYMGLKPFGREQAAYFFGREQAVRALLDRLVENRFLAVIGPSGCGKSSLVKAGLLPELENDRIPGSREWQVEIMTPGQYPLQALTNALEPQQGVNQPVVLFVDQFEELFTLCSNEEEQRTFIKRLSEETNDLAQQTRIIVAMRGDFLDRCAKFQESADLINSTAPTTYMVIPLTEAKLVADLEDSIVCPAELHGVNFEQGLVRLILNDVINQLGAMPLLQYALTQLWESCISPNGGLRMLTIHGYTEIEGVKGALQRWADQFYTNLSAIDQTFLKELIGELVQIGDAGEVTRRRASWQRLRAIAASQSQLDRIIGRLVYQRLLVADDKTVEVAHEALLSESRLIQGWIEENWESIRLQQRLETYCQEWQEHDRSESYLLDAGRLAAIDEWIEKKQPRLMSIDQEFIEKSRERRDRQFQAQLEQERKLREEAEGRAIAEIEKKIEAEKRAKADAEITRLATASAQKLRKRAIALGISLAVTLAAFTFAILQYRSVDFISKVNDVRRLQNLAETALKSDPMQSLILSLEIAGRGFKTESSQVLWQALEAVHEEFYLPGHSSVIVNGDFSSDGKSVLTVSQDGTAKIWDLNNIQQTQTLKTENEILTYGSFSPDNQRVLTIGYKESATLWDRSNLFQPINLPVPHGKLFNGIFSKDGHRVLTVGDGFAIVWSIENPGEPTQIASIDNPGNVANCNFDPRDPNKIILLGAAGDIRFINLKNSQENRFFSHEDYINFGVFHPTKSNIFLTASDDSSVHIWDVNHPSGSRPIATLKHGGDVFKVDFNPNNPEQILTVSGDKKVRVWNISALNRPQLIYTLSGHKDFIRNGMFDPHNSRRILTASLDGTARIWNLDSPDKTLILQGHNSPIYVAAFDPSNSERVLTGDLNGIARIWNLKPPQNPQILATHKSGLNAAVFAPNGLNKVLTVGNDSTARVWDLDKSATSISISEKTGEIWSGVFSPRDPNLILLGSGNWSAQIWRMKGNSVQLMSKIQHKNDVKVANFSPDGQKIVTASFDNTAKVLAVDTSGITKQIGVDLQHRSLVNHAIFSSQGDFVLTTSEDGTAKVWKVNNTSVNLIATFKHPDAVRYGKFNPKSEEQILTIGNDRIARLWNFKTPNAPPVEFKGHKGHLKWADFSHDGEKIATASEDGTARVWDISSGQSIELKAHKKAVNQIMFYPQNANLLVTASADGTAKAWNLRETDRPISLSGHTESIKTVHLRQVNSILQIVTASTDGTAKIYTLPSWEKLIDFAWSKASRCLTQEEKSIFLIDLNQTVPRTALLKKNTSPEEKLYPNCN